MSEQTIQELAASFSSMFEAATRTNGNKFWRVKDENNNNTALYDLIKTAHGERMPNDYIYLYIVEALDAISEHDDLDDISMEADIYNRDLLAWVADHSEHVGYCDEVMGVMQGQEMDFMQIIQWAQQRQKEEILYSVRSSLETILEGLEND